MAIGWRTGLPAAAMAAVTAAVLAVVLAAAGTGRPAMAAETAGQFGTRICKSVMAGEIEPEMAERYHIVLGAAAQSEAIYCGCVALAFETNFGAQRKRLEAPDADEAEVMLGIIHENMGACLPDTSDMIDGDLVESTPLDLQPDLDGCLMVLNDALWPAGFDLQAFRAKMRRAALNAGDICSCTASRMVEAHKQMNKKVADHEYTGSRWADNLGARMEECVENP